MGAAKGEEQRARGGNEEVKAWFPFSFFLSSPQPPTEMLDLSSIILLLNLRL